MERYTVLLVDDEPNILHALKRLFRGDSFDVITTTEASEALEIVRSRPVQLLISDNLMPGMTGVELIQKVKECSPDTVRIILSGQSDMESVVKAVNEGEAYRFVLKPWNDIDLQVTVHLALAHYKLQADNRSLQRELREQTQLLAQLMRKHPELFDNSLAQTQPDLEIESRPLVRTGE
ncbi:MAG: response regulator [bacterium]